MARRRGNSRDRAPRTGTGPGASFRPTGRYRFGRMLQFLGLLILPFGIASELVGRVGLGQSLLVASGGALLFYVGYVIQHGPGMNRDERG